MTTLIRLLLTQVLSGLKSRAELQSENLLLRHQIEILTHSQLKPVKVTRWDRLILLWLSRLWPRSKRAILVVHPKTLVRWHREGFCLYWRLRSRRTVGRPKVSNEICSLVRQMSKQNPLWGAPADPRRTSEARLRCEPGHGLTLPVTTAAKPGPDLEQLSAKPPRLHGRHRCPGGANPDFPHAICLGRAQPWPAQAGSRRHHCEPDCGLDGAADYRGLSLGRGAQIPPS